VRLSTSFVNGIDPPHPPKTAMRFGGWPIPAVTTGFMRLRRANSLDLPVWLERLAACHYQLVHGTRLSGFDVLPTMGTNRRWVIHCPRNLSDLHRFGDMMRVTAPRRQARSNIKTEDDVAHRIAFRRGSNSRAEIIST